MRLTDAVSRAGATGWSRALLATTCLLVAAPALAGPVGVVPFVELGTRHDSNVFRVEDAGEARALTGGDERSDTIHTGRVGVAAEWPMSRQKLTVAGEVSEHRYQRFEQVDHSENAVRAALDFAVGPAVTGTASLRRERRLDDFDDLNSTRPNFVTETHPQIEAFVEISPRWRVRTRVGRLRLDRSLASQQAFDLRENQATVELQYAGAPGSVIGAGVELLDGEYPNRDDNGVLSREFDQRTAFFSGNWRYSGVSSFRGRLGYTERKTSGAGGRSVSGPTGRLAYERRMSAKTRLTLEAFRQIYSVDDVNANFLRQTGGAAGLLWEYSLRLSLAAELRRTESAFEGASGFAGGRRDTEDEFTAELTWSPVDLLALIFSLTAESRDSNIDDESYDALVAGLALRLSLDND